MAALQVAKNPLELSIVPLRNPTGSSETPKVPRKSRSTKRFHKYPKPEGDILVLRQRQWWTIRGEGKSITFAPASGIGGITLIDTKGGDFLLERPEWLHPNQESLEVAIARSLSMLDIIPDSHEENMSGYSEDTWSRATGLLQAVSIEYWLKNRKVMAIPRIAPGPDGTIDIYWRIPILRLIINVPKEANSPANYYGESPKGIKEGYLSTSDTNAWVQLLEWLTN